MPDEFGDQTPISPVQILQIPRSMLVLLFSSAHSFTIGFRSGAGTVMADAWFWITVRLEDSNMARYKISSTGCQVLIFFFLSVGI